MTAEPISLIEMSVRDPAELYKLIGPMLQRFEQQMVYVPPKLYGDDPPPKTLFVQLAEKLEQIEQRHDLYTRNVQPCLLFWWMCGIHAGTNELLLACEPADSRWRDPAEFARLKKFASMHILSIKNTTIIPETVETLAAMFHIAMFAIIAGDRTVATWLFEADTRSRDEKIDKNSKSTGTARPVAPSNDTSCLAVQYLPGVCRGRAKKAAKAAGSRPGTGARRTLPSPTPMSSPHKRPDANTGHTDADTADLYNMFIIDGKRYRIE